MRVTIKLKFPLSSGVFPIAVPPLHKFEGTHGDRVAGDNTRCSHRKVSFSCYATRSRAKKIHTRPFTCTVRRASTLAFLAALRLAFSLRISTFRVQVGYE